ncbi:hypothetical protein ES707_07557 [subsurface metagenome]
MMFVKEVDVGETITLPETQHEYIDVAKGYLLRYDIRMISGTEIASTVRFSYHGTQILPRNRDAGLSVTGVFMNMQDFVPLLEAPYRIDMDFTNSAGTHNGVSVVLFVVEPELISFYLGGKAVKV